MLKKPRLVSLLVFLIGSILIVVSLHLPRPVIVDGEDTTVGLWTYLFDLGNGLVAFSLSMLLFMLVAKVREWRDFMSVKALERGWLVLISFLSSALSFPSSFLYYTLRARRGDYPPNHDTLSIPLAYSLAFGLILTLVVTVLASLVSQNCFLPASLGISAKEKSNRHRVRNIVFWTLVLLLILILVSYIIDGSQTDIPRVIAYLYVAFSIRAGKVAQRNVEMNPNITL